VSGTADEEGPLQGAVWLARDLSITMPPIPDVYAPILGEFSLGRLFATDESLLALDSRGALVEQLRAGDWPKVGLAFGFQAVGSGGLWFYTLVSEQIILLVSLRVSFASEAAERFDTAAISEANGYLEAFLSNEADYRRAISVDQPAHGAARRVVAYTNEDGVPEESQATLPPGERTLTFRADRQLFAPRESLGRPEEVMIRI
jgi:hypothetical protein